MRYVQNVIKIKKTPVGPDNFNINDNGAVPVFNL
jgi:hypothetical protein